MAERNKKQKTEIKELKKSVGEVQVATTPRPSVEEPVEEPKDKKK